jgi:hypothetical protein
MALDAATKKQASAGKSSAFMMAEPSTGQPAWPVPI